MGEDKNRVLAALKEAVQMEEEGKAFYLKASETAKDEDGSKMFRSLAEEEEIHLGLFRRQIESLEAGGEWVDIPEAQNAPVPTHNPMFPSEREEVERKTGDASDLEALIVGMEMEMKSFAYYNMQASIVPDPPARDMYRFIAGQEQEHFNTLMMRYQSFSVAPGM